MKIMVIGGGGREHAIIKRLKQNSQISKIYALPGNGGIANDAECVDINACDIEKIAAFAQQTGIDFAVIAPDDPLVLGAADELNKIGVPCFGPSKRAAEIEGSKVFSKSLMKKYGIPTAEYEVFDNQDKAVCYLQGCSYPIVVKADGLALGKGVTVAPDFETAVNAVKECMQDRVFGDSGNRVVIEEFLTGAEVSVLAFTDGVCVKPMVSAMDHKRAYDGDTGPNTGGMGAVAPNPYYTPQLAAECMEKIFLPTVRAMENEGRTFSGCLYFGLILTGQGPKVIEYNCRFGDPETQCVLPLMESDLLTVMQAVANQTLEETEVKFSDRHCACVVLSSKGYPVAYNKGYQIAINGEIDGEVYFAGVKRERDVLQTSGGRVLSVSATGKSLKEAVNSAYTGIEKISFRDSFCRKDIGKKALEAIYGVQNGF